MLDTKKTDPARVGIWNHFADQFLDTETRTWIPSAALACVEAGYSVEEARSIWRYEVTPVVGLNLWSVAGEWAGWPEEWLVERIEAVRRRQLGRPGPLSALGYWIEAGINDRAWRAIESLIRHFEQTAPSERSGRCAELTVLAEIYFDFCAPKQPAMSELRKAEMRQLYESIFLPTLGRLAVTCSITKESPAICRARVEAVLG